MHAGLGTQRGKGLEESSWTIWGGTAVVCAGLEMAHLDCVALQDLYNSLGKKKKQNLKDSAFLITTSKRARKEKFIQVCSANNY